MADADLALALSLQDEFSALENEETRNLSEKRKRPTSIVDDCWETIDPTPDIRELFLQFNGMYFDGKLSCCEVKWAPRMTLCAGVCCYEGRGGLCSIKLSMPLLKLRPRKDLVQTLLHEMIHAYLFVTNNNKDHDSHGPEFHKHMFRINKLTGANITVYHNFHDEVDLYRQHWWRCDGPCQKRPPYYGMVKRAMNRAPSPRDPWWPDHRRTCGGTYHKVREPEDYGKKKRKKEDSEKVEKKDTKGMRKIYDLFKKGNTATSETDGSSSSTNTKPNDSKNISNKDKYGGGNLSSSSTNDTTWRVENDDSSGKENDAEKINHAFTPFTGQGHVLGSKTSGNSVKQQGNIGKVAKGRDFNRGSSVEADEIRGIKSFLQKNSSSSSRSVGVDRSIIPSSSKEKIIDMNENDFLNDTFRDSRENAANNRFTKQEQSTLHRKISTESRGNISNKKEDQRKDTQEKKHLETQLTIVDAFKNVGGKSVPLVVINDTPTKASSVQCPVCLLEISENQINTHLDNCLS